jgi:5-keto 4-deoxyuronate isomerase
MRFEFKKLGLMSVAEFEEFVRGVCRRLSLGDRLYEERGNREATFESPDGSVRGYFNSDSADGELTVENRVTVELATHIEVFLRGKGAAPVVKVHAV